MSSYDESLKITCELLRSRVAPSRAIHPTDRIQGDLGLDSIDVMELAADVEARFGINIPSEMYERIATVEDVARAVVLLSDR
jgi:acyl carrier protein